MQVQMREKSTLRDVGPFTVIEESENFYLCEDPLRFGGVAVLQKCVYEPVPEKTWRDVTAECEVVDGELVRLDGTVFGEKVRGGPFRLRKVKLFDHGQENDGTPFLPRERHAFIVERLP